MTRRQLALALAPWGVSLLLALGTYTPILRSSDRQLAGRDVFTLYHPLFRRVAETQRSGSLPERDPLRGAGMAVVPDPNAQVFYPLGWMRALEPFEVWFKLWFVLHAALAGAGAATLARSLGAGPRGACLAAVAGTLAGPIVGAVRYPNLMSGAAWVGFAAAGFVGQEAGGRRGRRYLALGAFAVANMILCGGIELVMLLGLAVACWVPFWPRAGPRDALRSYARIASATALGALIAAAHLLPCLLWLEETGRGGGVTADVAGRWSMHPVRLLEMIVPALNQETSGSLKAVLARSSAPFGAPLHPSAHLGLPVLLLAVAAARRDRRARALAVAAVFWLLLALGTWTPVFRITRLLPLYDSWRHPSKALIPLAILVAGMAGAGLRAVPKQWRLPLAIATVVFLAVDNATCRPAQMPTLPLEVFQEPPPVAERILSREATRDGPPGRYLRLRRPRRPPPQGFEAIRLSHRETLEGDLASQYGVANLAVYGPFVHRRMRPYLVSIREGPGFDRARLAEDAGVAYILDGETLHTQEVPARARVIDGQGRCTIVSYDPERIVLDLTMETPGHVYLAESYDPAWRARLEDDGGVIPVEEARIAFMKVPVPAGEHRLVLTYQTRGLYLGIAGSLLGLLLLTWLYGIRPPRGAGNGSGGSGGAAPSGGDLGGLGPPSITHC